MVRIAVLGAGVIGLSTAVNIQERIPGSHVTIVADKFNQSTTSDGAGAIIVPYAPGIEEDTRIKWGKASMEHFINLAVSEKSSESGASIVMGIVLTPDAKPPGYSDLMLTCHPISQSALTKLNLSENYGHIVTTVSVYMRKYMHWLTQRFLNNGGTIIKRRVQSFKEFLGSYDLVVNCAGLGAKNLTDDDKLVPLRGQIFKVSAPWIKHFIHISNVTADVLPYFYSNAEYVTVGGTKQRGKTDLKVDPKNSQEIWDRATKLWPPLKGGTVLSEWVGLRPHREPPRVESELFTYGDEILKVVHNYGHGSTGVSLSWGTAIHATELSQRMLGYRAKL